MLGLCAGVAFAQVGGGLGSPGTSGGVANDPSPLSLPNPATDLSPNDESGVGRGNSLPTTKDDSLSDSTRDPARTMPNRPGEIPSYRERAQSGVADSPNPLSTPSGLKLGR